MNGTPVYGPAEVAQKFRHGAMDGETRAEVYDERRAEVQAVSGIFDDVFGSMPDKEAERHEANRRTVLRDPAFQSRRVVRLAARHVP